MNLSVGIVGLPNVGKSTLFNALLKKQQALAANYPFATIEPNIGIVAVPDSRLQKLAEITANEIAGHEPHPNPLLKGEGNLTFPPIKSATVEFVDIAGLVKGASVGEGLGNKFLSHIREVSIIAHVVRGFEDADIIREGSTTPKADFETITTELVLADLQTLEKAGSNRKTDMTQKTAIEKLKQGLDTGKRIDEIDLTPEEIESTRDLFLLSTKPVVVVINIAESDYTSEKIEGLRRKYATELHVPFDACVVICAKIESDLASLSEDEQKEYLKDLGLKESGLEQLIQKAYATLGLISFLTCGEKEVKAWTIKKGEVAPEAAGAIHTDFTKKFIKAEIVSYEDFVANNGWKGSREKGKARLEGKEYIMADGDVVEFKIGS